MLTGRAGKSRPNRVPARADGEQDRSKKRRRSSARRRASQLRLPIPNGQRICRGAGLSREFYEHVPPADVAARSPRDLCGAALSLWRFAERRASRPSQDPGLQSRAADGRLVVAAHDRRDRQRRHAVSGRFGDRARSTRGGRVVHLVIHPILTVARDAEGRLCDLDPSDAPGLRESWMQIEITPRARPGRARCASDARLGGVLADVRAAVDGLAGDAPDACAAIVAELRQRRTPPVPPRELAEGARFSALARRRQFHLSRLSRVRASTAAAKPSTRPLGILRDEAHPVFGGLRDLASLPRRRAGFRAPPRAARRHQDRTAARRSTAPRTWMRSASAGSAPTARSSGFALFLGLFTSLAYSRSPRADPAAAASRSGASSSAPACRRPAMTARRCCTSSTPFRATSCSRPARTSFTTPRSASSTCRSASASRYSSAATRSSALSPASSTCRATATTAHLRAALRGDPRTRRSPARSSTFYTHLDESALARVHFIIAHHAAARCRRSMSRRWSSSSPRPGAAGRTGSRGGGGGARRGRGARPAAPACSRFRSPIRRAPTPAQAIADLDRIEAVLAGSPLEASLHPARRRRRRRGCGSIGPASRWCCPTCCRSSKISGCGSSPRSRSGSRAPTAPSVWIHEFQLSPAARLPAG